MNENLFEEAYYSPSKNKIYVVLIAGNRIVRVLDDMYVVQWTPSFEAEFNRCICLGNL